MFPAGVHADQGAAAHPAALRAAGQLPGVREAVSGDRAVAAVLHRRDVSASDWKGDGQVSRLGTAGITLYRAHGRNGSDRVVEVTDESGATTSLTARHVVVVATGGTAALLPDTPGLADAKPWSRREAAAARTVPGRLAVIGGGGAAFG